MTSDLSSFAPGGGLRGLASKAKPQDGQFQQQPSEPSISTIQLDGEGYGHGLAAGNPFKTRKMDSLANPVPKDASIRAEKISAKVD